MSPLRKQRTLADIEHAGEIDNTVDGAHPMSPAVKRSLRRKWAARMSTAGDQAGRLIPRRLQEAHRGSLNLTSLDYKWADLEKHRVSNAFTPGSVNGTGTKVPSPIMGQKESSPSSFEQHPVQRRTKAPYHTQIHCPENAFKKENRRQCSSGVLSSTIVS
ncbi:hypothetical protein MTO96_003225 [Rhipicephalus appendiculatus]